MIVIIIIWSLYKIYITRHDLSNLFNDIFEYFFLIRSTVCAFTYWATKLNYELQYNMNHNILYNSSVQLHMHIILESLLRSTRWSWWSIALFDFAESWPRPMHKQQNKNRMTHQSTASLDCVFRTHFSLCCLLFVCYYSRCVHSKLVILYILMVHFLKVLNWQAYIKLMRITI